MRNRFALVIAFAASASAFAADPINADLTVFFSPRGGCTEAVVEELDRAQSNVLVQAYSFTSKPIAEALVNAAKCKVNGNRAPAVYPRLGYLHSDAGKVARTDRLLSAVMLTLPS